MMDMRTSWLRAWEGIWGKGPLDTLAFQLDCKLGQQTSMLGMTSKLQSACSTLTNTGSLSVLILKSQCHCSSSPWLPRFSSVPDCQVLELCMNSCVHQTSLNAEVKEELAIPNRIHKSLFKSRQIPKIGFSVHF